MKQSDLERSLYPVLPIRLPNISSRLPSSSADCGTCFAVSNESTMLLRHSPQLRRGHFALLFLCFCKQRHFLTGPERKGGGGGGLIMVTWHKSWLNILRGSYVPFRSFYDDFTINERVELLPL